MNIFKSELMILNKLIKIISNIEEIKVKNEMLVVYKIFIFDLVYYRV